MRAVFMGTPQLAAAVLERLAAAHEVVGVFTRPDAVRGRGRALVASPVKSVAEHLGLPVHTPPTLQGEEPLGILRSLAPDVICVSAYGVILPKAVLGVPPLGCLNVHTSLLPRWRGAAPIERAILAGDDTTGVCIMRMEEGLDTGDYCRRIEVPVDGAYAGELSETLAQVGADALLDALTSLDDGTVSWIPQGEAGAVYASKIMKGELALDPQDTASGSVSKVRASSAAHPARAAVAGRTLAVERARVVTGEADKALCSELEPGQALYRAKRLFARASDAPFEIERVRPDGKRSMDARSFAGGIQGIRNMELTWGRA